MDALKLTRKERFDRLWIADPTTGCHTWIGAKYRKYGAFRGDNKVTYKAHRWIFEFTNGPIRDGFCVMHKCDNPSCVNPDHLSIGTQLDNMRDMYGKKRANPPKGAKHSKAFLSENEVIKIRTLVSTGLSQKEVSKTMKIPYNTLHGIVRRRTWKHL